MTTSTERIRWAFETWAAGVGHTHENFVVDGTKYVGRVPATKHREAEAVLLAALPGLLDELGEAKRTMYALGWDQTAPTLAGQIEELAKAWSDTGRDWGRAISDAALVRGRYQAAVNVLHKNGIRWPIEETEPMLDPARIPPVAERPRRWWKR